MTISSRLANHRIANGRDTATGLEPAAPRRFDDFHNRLNAGITAPTQPTSRAPATAGSTTPGSRTTPTPARKPTISQMDVMFAKEAAAKRERERWNAVMSSPHANGRERGCTALLTHPKAFSADQILKHLASLPTDAEREASNPVNQARSDAMWDRAWNGDRPGAVTPSAAEPSGELTAAEKSDAAWAKAYGAPAASASAKEEQAPASKADDVWDRVWGSMGR